MDYLYVNNFAALQYFLIILTYIEKSVPVFIDKKTQRPISKMYRDNIMCDRLLLVTLVIG